MEAPSIAATAGRTSARGSLMVIGAAALVKLLFHLIAVNQYGYFRDELYYLASTQHLAAGYVEHPPFSIFLLAAQTSVFGDSLLAIRILPILAGAALVVFVGLMVREMNGGLFAQGLAAFTAAITPVYFATQHFFSMNALDQLFWVLSAYLLVRLVTTEDRRYWLLLGFTLGLGLLNKISVLWMGSGLALGLLFTGNRRWLATRWPWIAGAIALLVFLPHIIWQIHNDFPTLEFIRNATERKNVRSGALDFLKDQLLPINPAALPVYVAGLIGVFAQRGLRRWSIFGIIFLTTTAILIGSGTSKAYYLSAAYPLLLAPGAIALERLLTGTLWRRVGIAYGGIVLGAGLLALPIAVPVLPPETFISYLSSLGISVPSGERSRLGPLPQHFADMFGWEELARNVSTACERLTPEERRKCRVFAQNYGEAGAVDILGKKYGLPPAISRHNSYWLWGPRGWTGEVLIMVRGDSAEYAKEFESVTKVGESDNPYAMPYERHMSIFIGRNFKGSTAEAWQKEKDYI
jgi:hypothetical protein